MNPKSKILVTGGAGFIGSCLVDRLAKDNHEVIVIDDLSRGKKENINKKVKFYKIDICETRISQIFEKEKPEYIFHLAAQIDLRKSIQDPVFDAKVNVLGIINVLENSKKYRVKKNVFASSGGAVYGEANVIPTSENEPENPLSPYGLNKLLAEKYLNYYHHFLNSPFISLRLANVYGPRQRDDGEGGVVAVFCKQFLSGEQPRINGNGEQTRDFIFVDDVVEANVLAIKSEKSGVFNIATGKETDINTLFKKIKELTDSKFKEKRGPEIINEQKRSCLDWAKAKKDLNWQPEYSLDKGLEKTINYFRNNYENNSRNSIL